MVETAIVVRKSSTGELLIPTTDDIISCEYSATLIKTLETQPSRWISIVSDILSRSTPSDRIRQREGPHGMTLSYVDGAYVRVTRQAIARLGIPSDFEIMQTDVESEEVDILGKLTFKFSGQSATSMQWGDCQLRAGMSLGSCKKGAATDAEKKCMADFGWALDVYTAEPENAPPPPSPEVLKQQAVDKLLAVAKAVNMTEADIVREAGRDISTLSPAEMTTIRRRLERKAKEHSN